MWMVILVIIVISAALIAGAAWGLYGKFPSKVEGFLVAMAGGALIVSVMAELLEPAAEASSIPIVILSFLSGAVIFTLVDVYIDRHVGEDSGGGLLMAVVLDGVPENLALGVALIGSGPLGVLALTGSILLSNLPEAAGGARQMRNNGFSKLKAMGIWTATAAILSGAAIAGYLLLPSDAEMALAVIKSFAAGAVIASLATEVFPTAYEKDNDATGIAVAVGVALAFLLHEIG